MLRLTNEKNSKKKIINVLLFCFVIIFIYRVGTETKTYIDIDTDIWIGSGAESGGADGAEAVGMMGLTTIKNKTNAKN